MKMALAGGFAAPASLRRCFRILYGEKMVKDNLAHVRKRIAQAANRAGRGPESVKLIAVTKEAGLEQIKEAIALGVKDIGENRVNDARLKKEMLDSHILSWHMIGHLQSNKAGDAVKMFSIIHSLDSVKLAGVIEKQAKKIRKVQDIMIEVNVSGEKSKFGIKPESLENFLGEIRALKHVNPLGLMTMAPFTEDAETARPYFRRLRELRDTCGLTELSMGMTQDFEVAVEEGATMVRVGSAIFQTAPSIGK